MMRSAAVTVRRPGASREPATRTRTWRQTAVVKETAKGCIHAASTSGTLAGMAHASIRASPGGSVSTRASKYSLCSRTCGDVSSCGFQDGQHGRGPPEVEQSLAVGGNMLVMAGAEAEKVAEFIVSATEPSG